MILDAGVLARQHITPALTIIMPVTEVATLELVFPHTWDSPAVRVFFEMLAARQADWSGYPLCFFEDLENPRTIYLITLWESVPAHYEWIASAQNQELLERVKETNILKVVELKHVDVASEVTRAGVTRVSMSPRLVRPRLR